MSDFWDLPDAKQLYERMMEVAEQSARNADTVDKQTIALEELANRVVNLANKLEEHINTPDCHNPGVMRRK